MSRRTGVRCALGCVIVAAAVAIAVATGLIGSDDHPTTASAEQRHHTIPWVSTQERAEKGEALPCTGPKDPINFETFSSGPAVAGLSLTATLRRCDATAPADEKPANYLSYVYGHCKTPPRDDAGCAPPLEIQTWPACQRNISGYSFNGKPLPSRELPRRGGAAVVEFEVAGESRLEVYTKSSTVVIFAERPELAQKALELLSPQEIGKTPATEAADLQGVPPKSLASPDDGAMEGKLQCQS